MKNIKSIQEIKYYILLLSSTQKILTKEIHEVSFVKRNDFLWIYISDRENLYVSKLVWTKYVSFGYHMTMKFCMKVHNDLISFIL